MLRRLYYYNLSIQFQREELWKCNSSTGLLSEVKLHGFKLRFKSNLKILNIIKMKNKLTLKSLQKDLELLKSNTNSSIPW